MFGRRNKPKPEPAQEPAQEPARRASKAVFYIPRVTGDQGLFTDDRRGYIFSEVLKIICDYTQQPLPGEILKHADQAVQTYMLNYGMVLLLIDHEGSAIFYSANYRNKLPEAFTDRLRRDFSVMPEDTIQWSDDVFKTPQRGSAREIIWGQKLTQPKPSRGQAAKTWQHPEGLSASELDYLTGKSKKPPV